MDGHNGPWLPFGYYLECDADLLILRRSDTSFVAALSVPGTWTSSKWSGRSGRMPISSLWSVCRRILAHSRLGGSYKKPNRSPGGGNQIGLGLGCSQSTNPRCQIMYREAHSILRHSLDGSLQGSECHLSTNDPTSCG
jgi:hypothetical protein